MVLLHIIKVSTIRHLAFSLLLFLVGSVLLSACTQRGFTSSLDLRTGQSNICEKETKQKWTSYGIGEIIRVDCLHASSVAVAITKSKSYLMSPTIIYFSEKWKHKWAAKCYADASEIFSQCGIQIEEGKIIGVKSSDYARLDSRSKLAILRSRIDDKDFSLFPTILASSSYMENWMTIDGEENEVNGFVTRGGDDSNNAVVINASVRNNRDQCGRVIAHEWVHFIRDWPDNQYPDHDKSGHHPSEKNLLYKSLASTSLTKQQCRQIIENGTRRGIIWGMEGNGGKGRKEKG